MSAASREDNAGTDTERDQLRAEIEDLRAQLADAQDALRAIRSGEVDALVVRTDSGDQVFALENAYELYRVFVEQMQEGAAALNPDGLILYANPRLADIAGVPHSHLIGGSFPQIFGETNRGLIEALLADAIAAPREAEITVARADGGTVHAHLSATAMPDGTRCAVVSDLTERHRLGEVVASRDWLRVTLASIGDAVISCDLQGRITFLNAVAAALTGWGEQEALSQPLGHVLRIVDESTGQPGEDLVARALTEGKAILLGNHTGLVTRDGRRLSIEDSVAPIKDDAGTITGVVLVFHDVTEKRGFHLALEESEAKFRSLFECSADAVFFTNPDGRILAANPSACAMFGMTEQEICSRGRSGLLDPEDPRVGAILEQRRRTGVLTNCELTHVRKNGERFPGEMTSVILPGDGSHAFVVVRDITARKRADEQLVETAARLADANRTKDDFLATLSHELRTPMSAIVGWAQMLTTRKLDPEASERGLRAILRNSQAQMQLITDILDVSRIVSGRLRLNVQLVDLAAVAQAAQESLRPAADAKGITLTTSVSGPSTLISGDADRLQQVVWNLLSNAVKFTPAEGTVDVSLRRTGSQIALCVRDSGIGIDLAFLPRVFERFAQADTSAKRQHGGLGLGLSIVRHLVELHGGTVEAESEGEGRGAAFTVHLPVRAVQGVLRDAAAVASHTPQEQAMPGALSLAGVRVLVVDDEDDARDLLRTVLTDYHAEVVTASSAAEGLERLQQGRFDVLLADIGMPGEDGYQFVHHVRQLPRERGGTIPAAALTAYGRSEDAERALASGFQVHLTKPVLPDLLASTIAQLSSFARTPR